MQSVRLTEGGNVAVGFGGYEAEAGLGGLLRGDLSAGGLHASARTPNGQAAAAGLGGSTGASMYYSREFLCRKTIFACNSFAPFLYLQQ